MIIMVAKTMIMMMIMMMRAKEFVARDEQNWRSTLSRVSSTV